MCRIDFGDDSTLFHATMRRAAKDYRCGDCRRIIERGEQYQYATCLYDGNWSTYRTCAPCIAASEWLNVTCGGWLCEGIGEELVEHWDEEYELRSPGLGRLVLAHGRSWRSRGGKPYDVEQVKAWTASAVEHVQAIGAAA